MPGIDACGGKDSNAEDEKNGEKATPTATPEEINITVTPEDLIEFCESMDNTRYGRFVIVGDIFGGIRKTESGIELTSTVKYRRNLLAYYALHRNAKDGDTLIFSTGIQIDGVEETITELTVQSRNNVITTLVIPGTKQVVSESVDDSNTESVLVPSTLAVSRDASLGIAYRVKGDKAIRYREDTLENWVKLKDSLKYIDDSYGVTGLSWNRVENSDDIAICCEKDSLAMYEAEQELSIVLYGPEEDRVVYTIERQQRQSTEVYKMSFFNDKTDITKTKNGYQLTFSYWDYDSIPENIASKLKPGDIVKYKEPYTVNGGSYSSVCIRGNESGHYQIEDSLYEDLCFTGDHGLTYSSDHQELHEHFADVHSVTLPISDEFTAEWGSIGSDGKSFSNIEDFYKECGKRGTEGEWTGFTINVKDGEIMNISYNVYP